MHGLGPVFRDIIDSDVTINFQERHLPVHLVNNQETVKHFENQGVESIAVGMPYIYTKANIEKNREKILFRKLFMPPHSIIGNQYSDYSKWKTIIKKYNCDAICIGGNDHSNIINKKINFGDGVKILKGAHSGNDNSLTRISQMFYNTNEMITNVGGSHLTYAAASGVKVKAIDEIFELRDERLKNKLWLKEISLYPKKYQEKFKRHFASFRGTDKLVAIWNSKDTKGVEEYANNLLGTKYRKDQKIIREFLTPKSKIDEISFASNLLFNKIRQKIEKNFYKLTCSKIL